MTPKEIAELLIIAMNLANRIGQIAKSDPAVWDLIKDDYNKAAKAFQDAPAAGGTGNEAD